MTGIRVRGALLLTLVVGGGALAAEELPGVVDLRFGVHRGYDRLVVELDRETPLFRVPPTRPDETVLEVRARSPKAPPKLPPATSRIRGVLLDPLPDGTRIRVRGKGPVRVFRLHSPPRLVVDVADPGATPFNPPEGAEAVPAPEERPEKGAPAPAPVEAPPVEPEPAEKPPIATKPPPAPAEQPPVAPPPRRPRAERPKPLPYPPPDAPEGSFYDRWLALLVSVGGPLLLAGAGLYLLRRRREAVEEVAEVRSPETITPDEVLRASDRMDLLEKRIDEEVRGRMHVEQRLGQIQEDIKVVRDRINRLVRRGEPTG
jgi:hypothetical protein